MARHSAMPVLLLPLALMAACGSPVQRPDAPAFAPAAASLPLDGPQSPRTCDRVTPLSERLHFVDSGGSTN